MHYLNDYCCIHSIHKCRTIVLFYNLFPPSNDQPEQKKVGHTSSNILQTLLLYKTWVCYDKFHSTKCLGYATDMPKYHDAGMWAWINDITFYVEKYIATRTICYNYPLVPYKPLRAPAFVRLLYHSWFNSHSTTTTQDSHIRLSYCINSHFTITFRFTQKYSLRNTASDHTTVLTALYYVGSLHNSLFAMGHWTIAKIKI